MHVHDAFFCGLCLALCDPATTDEAEVISRLQRILYQSGPIRASDVGMRFELIHRHARSARADGLMVELHLRVMRVYAPG